MPTTFSTDETEKQKTFKEPLHKKLRILARKTRFVRCDRQLQGFLIGKSHRLVETGRRPTPPVGENLFSRVPS
jgi:hypothetical protein